MIKVVLLLGLGLALIVAEVLIPSGGILGIVSTLCVVGAVAWAFSMSATAGMQVLVATAVLVPIFFFVAFRLLPMSPFARKLMARGFSFDEGRGVDLRDGALAGRVGLVEAPLRPVGTARFDGRRVDVTSRGELIESGASVRVIEVRGNRVLVARNEHTGADGATEENA